MNILILGKGGREHALGWKLLQSERRSHLFFLPGNAGTLSVGVNLDGDYNKFDDVKRAVVENGINLVVVGPEEPIARGVADFLEDMGMDVIAPRKDVAFLEASKIEAKKFMKKHGIPTADFVTFDSYQEAKAYIERVGKFPLVIKADGLCGGKGVVIARDKKEAVDTLRDFMVDGRFGEASRRVVIEEFLKGYEFSVFVYLEGEMYVVLGDAIDYKRAYDGDKGPNTGGMGSVAPAIFLDSGMREKVKKDIIDRTIEGLMKDGLYYKGFLYFGLIWTEKGPYVLEYNVRMGDPETQVVVMIDSRDWLEFFKGNHLDKKWPYYSRVCVEVVLVSSGYPLKYDKGYIIEGLNRVEGVNVFHAGTVMKEGRIITNGGRVLNVVGCGKELKEAREKVYKEVRKIKFKNVFYRKDIGDLQRWRGIL